MTARSIFRGTSAALSIPTFCNYGNSLRKVRPSLLLKSCAAQESAWHGQNQKNQQEQYGGDDSDYREVAEPAEAAENRRVEEPEEPVRKEKDRHKVAPLHARELAFPRERPAV